MTWQFFDGPRDDPDPLAERLAAIRDRFCAVEDRVEAARRAGPEVHAGDSICPAPGTDIMSPIHFLRRGIALRVGEGRGSLFFFGFTVPPVWHCERFFCPFTILLLEFPGKCSIHDCTETAVVFLSAHLRAGEGAAMGQLGRLALFADVHTARPKRVARFLCAENVDSVLEPSLQRARERLSRHRHDVLIACENASTEPMAESCRCIRRDDPTLTMLALLEHPNAA